MPHAAAARCATRGQRQRERGSRAAARAAAAARKPRRRVRGRERYGKRPLWRQDRGRLFFAAYIDILLPRSISLSLTTMTMKVTTTV
uniref:Uncharacterized protein n=1 Tax=Leersia perrieri TaxID=77586 RepID=A0A0D9XF03_9ORYZ